MLKTGNDYPIAFLEELYENRTRTLYTKIELLSWDEQVLGEIQGVTESGTFSADGSSASRRSLNLSMSAIDRNDDLVFSYLTPDKKVRLYVGMENTTHLRQDEDIIWFNLGIYVLTNPSYSHSIDRLEVSLTANDKMALMNGTIGGKLASPVSFSERKNGVLQSMSWREIFMQSAVLFGGEDPARVVVEDVPDYIKEYIQVKTVGGQADSYVHINAKLEPGQDEKTVERIITRAWHPSIPETQVKFKKGQNLYKLNRFGPPNPTTSNSESVQPYIKNSGEPVANIFEDARQALNSTHEYYYNAEGDLIFAPIQNFINTNFDPDIDTNLGYSSYELEDEFYIPDYSNLPYVYDFSNKTTIDSYTNNPDWTNLKNDFIVTGKNGQQLEIAIDHKPTIKETQEWFKGVAMDFNKESPELDFLAKDGRRREPYNPRTNTVPFEYREGVGNRAPIYVDVPLDKIPWQIAHGLRNYYTRNLYGGMGQERIMPRWGKECESMIFKWFPSINKDMLLPNTGIFDPSRVDIQEPWLNGYPIAKSADTEDDVEELDKSNPKFTATGDSKFWTYFLDIVDSESVLGKFSIEHIGKRTETESNSDADVMFRTNPTELVVVTETELALLGGDPILKDLKKNGQAYAVVKDSNDQKFKPAILTSAGNKTPYVFIKGNPNANEDMYLMYDGSSKKFRVGGKSKIVFSPNEALNGVQQDGGFSISGDNFMHPTTFKVYEGKEAFINTPIALGTDKTKYGFIVQVDNKKALPNSGSHPFLVAAKTVGEEWYYAEQSNPKKPTWKKFTFNLEKDSIVGAFTQLVSSGDGDDYYGGSLDTLNDLFNIREMENTGLFSIGGGIDCFSLIRNLIYKHTNTAEVVSLSLLPMYNLEPNTLIRIENELTNISGTFMITSFSIPLETTGAAKMSLNAIRVPERI